MDDSLLYILFNMVPLLYFSVSPTTFGPVPYKSISTPYLPSCTAPALLPGERWDKSEYRQGAEERPISCQHLLLPHAWHQHQGCCSHPFLMGLMSLALNISRLSGIEGNLRFLYGDDVSDSLRFKEAASGN